MTDLDKTRSMIDSKFAIWWAALKPDQRRVIDKDAASVGFYAGVASSFDIVEGLEKIKS